MKNAKNKVVHVKLYSNTKTRKDNTNLDTHKFLLHESYLNSNHLSNIKKYIASKLEFYNIKPGDTVVLYTYKHENLFVLTQVINMFIYLHIFLVLEIHESEDVSYAIPILEYNSDNASTKYISRVTAYVNKINLTDLDGLEVGDDED